MKKETLTWFDKIFRPKLYDKIMREKLLMIFDELLDDDSEINERLEVINEYRVDDLLDKITKSGLKSLTNDELTASSFDNSSFIFIVSLLLIFSSIICFNDVNISNLVYFLHLIDISKKLKLKFVKNNKLIFSISFVELYFVYNSK